MTREKYEKFAMPKIKKIANQFGIEFADDDYVKVIDDAFHMVNTASNMYKQDITKNPKTHKEILRSSIISIYKKTHKVPYASMTLNIAAGFMILKYYLEIVSPWCQFGTANYWIAMGTCAIILYGLCRNHNSFMDKIIPRKVKIKRWKAMELK